MNNDPVSILDVCERCSKYAPVYEVPVRDRVEWICNKCFNGDHLSLVGK